MEKLMKRYPRLVGVIFLIAGISFTYGIKDAHDSGGSTEQIWIILTPALLLYGVAVVMQPRLLLLKGEFASAPALYKLINILIGVVGLSIGLFLRLVVFKDWR